MKNYLKKKRRQRAYFFIITGPAISAHNMLDISPDDPGLNMATVRRNLDWCWSTYSYVGEHLSKKQCKSIETLISHLQDRIAEFDWDAIGDRQWDGYSDAMRFYNNHFQR